MAILRSVSHIINFKGFLEGLQQAAQGVLLVQSGGVSCTGWLITDTLVVLPPSIGYGTTFDCISSLEPTKIIQADYLAGLSIIKEKPALLRLRQALTSRALSFATASCKQADILFLLHHAGGQPNLSLSVGELVAVDEQSIYHGADTLPGSSGAPMLNASYEVIGMHTSRSSPSNRAAPYSNSGISIAAILDEFRTTQAWAEIAQYHNLVDITTVQRNLEANSAAYSPRAKSIATDAINGQLAAAVLWSFDPATLAKADKAQLKSLVINPADERWILRANERQRLLNSAASLAELRAARGDLTSSDPRQPVIDAILAGPPYQLDAVADDALPYWLQAVRWFANIAPSLPTPAEVNQLLTRRRVRGRLREIVGPEFRGRKEELDKLQTWYAAQPAGPMLISGIGGIGKSALVAQFALNLPATTPLFWLDFDRADVAPDDALSVLRLLFEQAAVQLKSITTPPLDDTDPSVDDTIWKEAAGTFGAALVTAGANALLVLDGFEVAQHAQRYQEIWELLEQILAKMPTLAILVSGRAPVTNLSLHGHAAVPLILTGLARPDAEAWLRNYGITDAGILNRVLDIAKGIPLVLALIVQWLNAGGNAQELPKELPNMLIEGFLYQRILDRVIDPALKPVARGVLVLRRLTPAMLPAIIAEDLPKDLEPQEVFTNLAREMALVQGKDEPPHPQAPSVVLTADENVLCLRPEVRLSALRLLEMEDQAHVQKIDKRAVAWYKKQDLNEVANRAELVYHQLRLGKIDDAEAVWNDACVPLLLHAVEELPENKKAAREWLSKRIAPTSPSAQIAAWEQTALSEIRAALSRQKLRIVPGVLDEYKERSAASPLVVYDAWRLWQEGDIPQARQLLQNRDGLPTGVARDRILLAALLAVNANDYAEADTLLMSLDNQTLWRDWESASQPTLAIQAARIHLAVDLAKELALSETIHHTETGYVFTQWSVHFLPSADVVLSLLSLRLWEANSSGLEVGSIIRGLPIPKETQDLSTFANQIDEIRRRQLAEPDQFFLALSEVRADKQTLSPWQPDALDMETWMANQFQAQLADGFSHVLNLALLGWRRWQLVTTNLFLNQACQQVLQRSAVGDDFHLAILGTLAIFQGNEQNQYMLEFEKQSLNHLIDKVLTTQRSTKELSLPIERVSLAIRILRHIRDTRGVDNKILPWLEESINRYAPDQHQAQRVNVPISLLRSLGASEWSGPCLYLLTPSPLEALVQKQLGFA